MLIGSWKWMPAICDLFSHIYFVVGENEFVYYWKIYNLSIWALEKGIKGSLWWAFSGLFICGECILKICLPTIYVYCGLPSMSKRPKQLTSLAEKNWNNHCVNHFQGCPI